MLDAENPGDDIKSSAEARGKRIKSLRMMADLSRKDVGDKYQISAGTLRGWEEARSGGLTENGARRLLTVFRKEGIQCSIEWLLHGTGIPPQVSDKLYQGEAGSLLQDTDLGQQPESWEDPIILSELLHFRKVNPDAVDMLVVDNGMEPLFHQGDYVAGRRRYNEEVENVIGRNCIIETTQGKLYLRQLQRGTKKGLYTLICINLNFSPEDAILYNVDIVSAAPVIWHRMKDD